MTYLVRFAPEAELDLLQLYEFILERDGGQDHFADKAFEAIKHGVTHLSFAPFNCRKAYPGKDPYLRELVIPFGASGYVALFEIEPQEVVTVIAVRHQREDDFY